MTQPNKLDCSITQLEMLANEKHSSLLGQFLSYEENEELWICTVGSILTKGLYTSYDQILNGVHYW